MYGIHALQAFKRKSGYTIIRPLICKKMPWFAFSPDGVVAEGENFVGLLEIKCPYIGKVSIVHLLLFI